MSLTTIRDLLRFKDVLIFQIRRMFTAGASTEIATAFLQHHAFNL